MSRNVNKWIKDIGIRAENLLDYYKDSPEEWYEGLKAFVEAHNQVTLFQCKLIELVHAKEEREKRDAITENQPSNSEVAGNDTESVS